MCRKEYLAFAKSRKHTVKKIRRQLAMLQKLGRKTAFIGKVGQDGFGLQLEKALKETGISTEGLCFDKEVHTTLAVVQKKEDGDRDFSLWFPFSYR